jgi:hypothetical protein
VWIREQSDTFVVALIREHPMWLRNPAVADRVSLWRYKMVSEDDEAASRWLKHIASRYVLTGSRGRPTRGPRHPVEVLRITMDAVLKQRRRERDVWLTARQGIDSSSLLEVGQAFWRQLNGWTREHVSRSGRRWAIPSLEREPLIQHLSRNLVIVRDTSDDETRWVVIDDDGWPRAAAVSLLAARWKVSKGWVLKKAVSRERNIPK